MTVTTEPVAPVEHYDRSPMLPQPCLDNAPMIGGRGARLIVEARGAYLAGNLQALIERLDGAQRDRLHACMVAQAIAYARHAVPAYAWHPSVEITIDASTRSLDTVSEWLTDRSPQAAYDMIDVLASAEIVSTTNCVSTYGMMFAFLSCALLTTVMDDIVFWITRSISCALYHRHKCRQLTEEEVRIGKQAAARWQVEAAWAILHHHAPPALEVI